MYLSRLRFDPTNRQVLQELGNRYELHRTLCAQFNGTRREEIGLLYRIETGNAYEMSPITLLAQTKVEPCWDNLYAKGLLIEKAETKPFEPILSVGDQLVFRLLANPTLRRNSGDWAGKRVGLLKEEEQQDWIRRKGKNGGFEVIQLDVRQAGKVEGSKYMDGQKHTLSYLAVLFEGLLKVNDPASVRKTMEGGIGSGKGFGFGLLSLARV